MRMSWKLMAVGGVMGVGLFTLSVASAEAGCGGGRGTRGGYGGGHTFARTAASYGGGSCCNMGGMPMGGGMAMGGMAMPATQAPMTGMQGMNMGGYAAPAPAAPAAGGQYHCAMHPNVVSATPGTCPICHMALTK